MLVVPYEDGLPRSPGVDDDLFLLGVQRFIEGDINGETLCKYTGLFVAVIGAPDIAIPSEIKSSNSSSHSAYSSEKSK